MYKSQVTRINKDLKNTKRAIIAIGCSFVQGQGAFDDELYENFKWKYTEGLPLVIDASSKERKRISKNYQGVSNSMHGMDFTMMEYKNAFVSVLCNKYFNGKYTPINLGLRGCGNRASIKELYMYPEINYNELKEIIVLYMPSGLERFDFVNDVAVDHFNWKCMWPHYKDMEESPRKTLWEGYAKTLSSDKFEVIEQLAHVQELMSWCKSKKAKLIITPGFDRRYDKDYFRECLSKEVTRKDELFVKSTKPILSKSASDKTNLLELFPWNNMFKPDGHTTFADLVIAQEDKLDDKHDHYFQFLGKGSYNGWMTPCSHPSQKGHDLFAKHLYNYINNI